MKLFFSSLEGNIRKYNIILKETSIEKKN